MNLPGRIQLARSQTQHCQPAEGILEGNETTAMAAGGEAMSNLPSVKTMALRDSANVVSSSTEQRQEIVWAEKTVVFLKSKPTVIRLVTLARPRAKSVHIPQSSVFTTKQPLSLDGPLLAGAVPKLRVSRALLLNCI